MPSDDEIRQQALAVLRESWHRLLMLSNGRPGRAAGLLFDFSADVNFELRVPHDTLTARLFERWQLQQRAGELP